MNALLVPGTASDAGDLIAGHVDTRALLRLIEGGAPAGLPFIPPGAP